MRSDSRFGRPDDVEGAQLLDFALELAAGGENIAAAERTGFLSLATRYLKNRAAGIHAGERHGDV